ncbi:MAG: type II toxin-antitoxin system VapC family toxin [Deinococcus sp.]
MTTPALRAALDSNILNALLRREANATQAAALLAHLQQTHTLVICPVVYAELLAGPGATVGHLRPFLTSTEIVLDEQLPLEVWEASGRAYGDYAQRRQESGEGLPRRLLADFVVGAHADQTCGTLVTLDPQHYQLGFPGLKIVVP